MLSEQPDAQAGQHRDHHFTDEITGAEKGTRNSPRSETRTFSSPVRPVCSFLSHQLTTSSVPSCREAPLTPVGLGESSSSTGPNTPEKPLQYSRAKTLRGFQARLLTKHLLEFRHKGTFNRTGLPGQSSSSVKAPNNLACNYILSCIVSDCVVNFVSSAQLEAGGQEQARLTSGPPGRRGLRIAWEIDCPQQLPGCSEQAPFSILLPATLPSTPHPHHTPTQKGRCPQLQKELSRPLYQHSATNVNPGPQATCERYQPNVTWGLFLK